MKNETLLEIMDCNYCNIAATSRLINIEIDKYANDVQPDKMTEYCLFISVLLLILIFVDSFDIIDILLPAWNRLRKLHDAIQNNDTQVALALIQQDPSLINKVSQPAKGYTPFLSASAKCNTELIRMMLHMGADRHAKTVRGENAFYLAVYNRIQNCESNDASSLHVLCHAGVNIDEANMYGVRPVHLTAIFGHRRMLRWLVEKHVNLNVKPHPFMVALRHGCTQTARYMIRTYPRLIESITAADFEYITQDKINTGRLVVQ